MFFFLPRSDRWKKGNKQDKALIWSLASLCWFPESYCSISDPKATAVVNAGVQLMMRMFNEQRVCVRAHAQTLIYTYSPDMFSFDFSNPHSFIPG